LVGGELPVGVGRVPGHAPGEIGRANVLEARQPVGLEVEPELGEGTGLARGHLAEAVDAREHGCGAGAARAGLAGEGDAAVSAVGHVVHPLALVRVDALARVLERYLWHAPATLSAPRAGQ